MLEQERPKIVGIERGYAIRIRRGIERTLKEMEGFENLLKENAERLRIAMKLNSQGVKNDGEIEILLDEMQLMEKTWDALKKQVEQGTALLDEMHGYIEKALKEKEGDIPPKE
ncbi:hypothetical protein HY622_01965 [Candidatus Uhrbacteria bacterium]|nr:hypothetical protein [Candidatus Uhrbacteria bacterium]